MRLLVTGGCGFIGSHFIRLILHEHPDVEVLNVDLMTYAAHPECSAQLGSLGGTRYQELRQDIAHPTLLAQLEKEHFHAIVHFAAESHVDRSILEPGVFVSTNVLGTQNLLTLAKQRGNLRMLHVSTDEVYGSLLPHAPASKETDALDPNSPYAASKSAADLLVIAAHRTHGQNVSITRASNNYGPYQFPEKLIPVVISRALENQSIPVYGDGKQVREWIHATDHCRAIFKVLTEGRAGEIYNIGTGQGMTNLELIRQLLELLGKPDSLIEFVQDRPAHDTRYALNCEKINRELGWKAQVGMDEGLLETVQWYLDHPGWWKALMDQKYQKYVNQNYGPKKQGQDQPKEIHP